MRIGFEVKGKEKVVDFIALKNIIGEFLVKL